MLLLRVMVLVLVGVLPIAAFAQDADPEAAAEPSEVIEESGEEEDPPEAEPAKTTAKAKAKVAPNVTPELLLSENEGRARTNRIGGLVIGGWAIGNFTWATIGMLGQPEDRERAFHLTNAAVNLVVAGVAVGTYFSNVPDESWDELGAIETLDEAHATEKLYLLAAGLDVAYIMTGAFLTAKGNVDRKEGMIGTGRSLMLQGSFLLVFDAAMFTLHMLRRSKFVRQLVGAQ